MKTEELLVKLSEPLPTQAFEQMRDGFTAIKDIFVYERLNSVFGPGGWTAEPTLVSKYDQSVGLPEIIMRCDLKIPEFQIHKIGFGGHGDTAMANGDNYQAAFTDAFGKCWKQLGIGSEVWKGEVSKNLYPEIDKRQIDAHASRPTQLTGSDLVYFDGIVTEVLDTPNKKYVWLNVAGWTVRVSGAPDSDPYLFFMHKRIRFRAKWGCFKKPGNPRFLDVTEILEIKTVEPIKVHEVKE